MKNLIVIPARYGSVRLHAKPLAVVHGKTLIEHVYSSVVKSKRADAVVVATDDMRISSIVESFGGRAIMTSPDHSCGTERVREAAAAFDAEFIINVQGDEPTMPAELLDRIFETLATREARLVTAARKMRDDTEFSDPARVKVICNKFGIAALFTRASIPHPREPQHVAAAHNYARIHVGVYGFSADLLDEYGRMEPTELETIERLEQLRFLYAGEPIKVIECSDFGDSIDTPKDLERFASMFK